MPDPNYGRRKQWIVPLLLFVLLLLITWVLAPGNWAAFYAVGVAGGVILGTIGFVSAVRDARKQNRDRP